MLAESTKYCSTGLTQISVVHSPPLKAWRFGKRFLFIASLYLVLGFWAATVAAPGTIEGMVYMRPLITPHGTWQSSQRSSGRV